MPFLYFPEDKWAYLPATLTLLLFITLACVAMYYFYKKSKKEEQQFNEKYKEQLKNAKTNTDEQRSQ